MNLKLLSVALNVHNIDKPVCKDCKYFKYDPIYNDYQYGAASLVI